MTNDVESVRSRLVSIKELFESLVTEVQKDAPNRSVVKEKYGVLKVKLRSDTKVFETLKGQKQASENETLFYYPAITEAYLELKVKIDAPPNQKMLECLVSGEGYISHYLSQLHT